MNRLDYWKAKLKVAKVENRIREKEWNSAARAYSRSCDKLEKLEAKVEAYLAKSK